MIGYYGIVQLFNNLSSAHPNIEKFTCNEVEDFDVWKSKVYPLCHLVTNDITLSDGLMRYNITLIVGDRVTQITPESSGSDNTLVRDFRGIDNTLDVINSCVGVCVDMFSWLQRNSRGTQLSVTLDGTITPFVEKGDNIVAGASATLYIDTPLDSNACLLNISVNEAMGGTDDCGTEKIPETFFILNEDKSYILQEDTSKLKWK